MFAYDDVRHCSLSTKKEQAHRVDVSLTVFISVPGAIVLFVLVATAGLYGSLGLPTFVSTIAIMAAIATKTNIWPTFEEGLEVNRIVTAALDSSAIGAWVNVADY